MRFVHLSDTHLGFSAYPRTHPAEGVNQREIDFYDAFEQAIDKIIQLKPDFVVHSGDLFDQVRPQNRAITFALRQLLRLSEAGLETILISGNHSTPKLRETGNIFRIFEHLDKVHPIHTSGAVQIEVGDATVTAIPHSTTPPLAEVVSKARPSAKSRFNVLVLHAGISGSQIYKMDEFNEQTVPLDELSDGWDYVALGHFHQHREVAKMICYSGSTERLGFGEAGERKGFLEVNLERGGLTFHELKLREMLDLKPLDAAGKASSEIQKEARDRVSSSDIEDKIVRLVIDNVSPDAYKSLDSAQIRRLGSSAMHFELAIKRSDPEGRKDSSDTRIGVLADEFSRYVSELEVTPEKKSLLLQLGMPYITREQE